MIHSLSYSEFQERLKLSRKTDKANSNLYFFASHAINQFWTKRLGLNKASILLWITNRTLYYERPAEQIYKYQFTKGIIRSSDGAVICEGLDQSDNTLRKHIRELAEQDFIEIYCLRDDGTAEVTPRIYEINCNLVLQPIYERERKMLPTPKKKTITPPNDWEGVPQNLRVPPSTIEGASTTEGHKKHINNRRDKSLLSADADSGLGDLNRTPRIAEPKKPRAIREPEERSVTEVAETITQKSMRMKAAHLAAAQQKQPHLLTMQEMQAVFRNAMEYAPKGTPTITVAAKPYRVLRDRLKESAPDDFKKFVQRTLGQWLNTVIAQHRSIDKKLQAGDTKVPEKLPYCPDFATIAYRYGYFLKVYSSYAIGHGVKDETENDAKVQKLSQQLRAAKQDNAALRQIVKARPRAQRQEELQSISKRVVRLKEKTDVAASSDALAEWEGRKRAG